MGCDRCARNCRSFESVVDDLHHQEVELLRPGTELPTAATVSNDVKSIYLDGSIAVAQYLQVFKLVILSSLHSLILII